LREIGWDLGWNHSAEKIFYFEKFIVINPSTWVEPSEVQSHLAKKPSI
jgi:hypothetical protein